MTEPMQAERLRRAALRTIRVNSEVALLCELALSAADRLAVLERESEEFYQSWQTARREVEALRPVADAAIELVSVAAWCCVSDEDIALEEALRDAGRLLPGARNDELKRRDTRE